MSVTPALASFVAEVAGSDPVCVAGGRTQWSVGGTVDPSARVVLAPAGVVSYQPAEMTVRAGAGTALDELHAALGAHGQTTVLEGAAGATIGGVLAVGHSGLRRRRVGPLRDALLELRYASADARLITAGGPTVKNVTGYDLCRLHVGALGTLGLIGEVVLRTRPAPPAARWLAGPADPFALAAALFRPSAVLWNGTTTWVLVEGHAADVRAQSDVAAQHGLAEAGGPPVLPPIRSSLPPAELTDLDPHELPFIAEVGVGVVHSDRALGTTPPAPEIVELHRRLKLAFDPSGRLNPGRDPLARHLVAA